MTLPEDDDHDVGEASVILCDYCLRPVGFGEVVTDAGRDYHPDCPQRRMTDEELQECRAVIDEAR